MTDQTIPADKVQAVVDWLLDEELANGGLDEEIAPTLAARAQMCWEVRAKLLALLRPTLADMTDEERAACIRMQCDTGPNRSVRGFIADVYPGGCRVIERDTCKWRSCSDDLVTPRPDLPRMEWPSDKAADTPDAVPPNTLAVGSVWDDADALTLACRQSELNQIAVIDCDGDVHVWGADAEWWQTWPSYGCAPYAIIHAGKKADQ